MLTHALLALGTCLVIAGGLYLFGGGSFRRGRVRTVRRVRALRRRRIRPLLDRLERTGSRALTRPARAAVAAQVARLADRVERLAARADDFVDAQGGLSETASRLAALLPDDLLAPLSPRPGPGGTPRSRKARGPLRSFAPGPLLVLAGAALAAAHAWALHRHLLPGLPAPDALPAIPTVLAASALARPDLGAGLVAGLPVLLGLVAAALTTAGRPLGLRLLGGLAALLVVAIAAVEAAAAVVVLEHAGILRWGWDGVAIATVAGGVASLLGPTTAALCHAGAIRVADRIRQRERWNARRDAARQDGLVAGLHAGVDRLAAAAESMRAEVGALSAEPAGSLLLRRGERPTAERAGDALRRLAAAVRRDDGGPWVETPPAAELAARALVDVAALLAWLVSAAAAVGLTAAALRHGAGLGLEPLMTAAIFTALATLLAGGLLVRAATRVSETAPAPGFRAAAVLLLTLTTATLAAALGPLVAAGVPALPAWHPAAAGAWIAVPVLVAAASSTRLPEGLAAAAAALTSTLVAGPWLALAALDLTLAATERTLAPLARLARLAPTRRRQPARAGTAEAKPGTDPEARSLLVSRRPRH